MLHLDLPYEHYMTQFYLVFTSLYEVNFMCECNLYGWVWFFQVHHGCHGNYADVLMRNVTSYFRADFD